MLDLNHGSNAAVKPPDFADKVNEVINAGIKKRIAKRKPSNVLGAAQLGDPCMRRLVYKRMGIEPDEPLNAKSMRIFDIGQEMEDFLGGAVAETDAVHERAASARWFHDAGFDLRTKGTDGRQFGWRILDNAVKGFIDGVFLGGPDIEGMHYPALWEAKALNQKGWSKIRKHGVRIGNEIYFGQMQVNMAYLDVGHTLFTAINKNTSELYHELITFDPAVAQRLSDRALEVITAATKGELLPRVAANKDYFVCRFCNFSQRCWTP